jgi:methylase of polypeptide subunit release factors
VGYKRGMIKNHSFGEIFSNLTDIENANFEVFDFDFFFWIGINNELFQKVYNEIKGLKFEKQDIFSQLYQQIFISDLRHKRGEFFTPSYLVNKMVDDFYEIGLKILDPSCGSGTFLVNIVLTILNSKSQVKEKIKAIANIYGFDVNPLAIITSKVNVFLIILDYFAPDYQELPNINLFLCDSLFPEDYEEIQHLNFRDLYNSFDLIIGNPPWLTYKDLYDKDYQTNIRKLTDELGIKPSSQYITHIEIAAVFFYAVPVKFLKNNGKIFFVMPKSSLNGDHCYEFRAFSIFNKSLEIWDFPNNYFFNVHHICLKAVYIGINNNISTSERYPIKTKIFNNILELLEETYYSSLKVEDDGAKLILPSDEIERLNKVETSGYKKRFFQGATLVPGTLVFFQIREKKNGNLIIESDPEILSRAKKKWVFHFQNKEIEQRFRFKTFLNIHLIPFHLKTLKDVFLPINEQSEFSSEFLQRHPKAQSFYNEVNKFYKENKKDTSDIDTLYDNLNYWNKLQKQDNNKSFIVVYNASGSNLKAAVINNEEQKVIIGSENYYFSTDLEEEAYYLSAVLNAPNLSKNIKLIKSSRHIHKRPFDFPIPIYDENNTIHKKLAKKAKTCHVLVQELFIKNPKITAEKVRIFINRKLVKIQELTEEIVFK